METYFTIEELAQYLRCGEKTIRKWVLNRQIPFHKINKPIRFRLSEIEKWIDGDGAQVTAQIAAQIAAQSAAQIAGEETETADGGENGELEIKEAAND